VAKAGELDYPVRGPWGAILVIILPWWKRMLPALVAALVSVCSAVAGDLPRFAGGTSRVLLSATVVDSKGRPVRDLRAQEFRIFEEGRPQALVHFVAGVGQPARLLLLADASGSMNASAKAASVRMTITQLLAGLGPGDQAALAGFDSRYFGVVPFSGDREKILTKLEELRPFGSTALHDALDRAAQDIASHGEGRRAVVVLTDGIDNASEKTADEVIARSRALDVPIYAVSVISPLDDPSSGLFVGPGDTARGAAVLRRYSELSGGRSYAVSDFRALKLAADQIIGELKHQYRLGYEPPAGPASFRRVEVRTTRRGVIVRTRRGYVPAS
jgi:Ca-activated chloride channel family protein